MIESYPDEAALNPNDIQFHDNVRRMLESTMKPGNIPVISQKETSMKLNTVTVTRADSGLSYALKRIGYIYDSRDDIDFAWLEDQINHGVFVEVDETKDTLKTGDILVTEFMDETDYLTLPTRIDETGILITLPNYKKLLYVAVYEKNNIVSMMLCHDQENASHPFIEAQYLDIFRSFDHMPNAVFVRTFAVRLKDKSCLRDKNNGIIQSAMEEHW